MKQTAFIPCRCTTRQKVLGDGCDICNPMIAIEFMGVSVGDPTQRTPCGRVCTVLALDGDSRKILINDPGRWRGYVSVKTFVKKWQVVRTNNG